MDHDTLILVTATIAGGDHVLKTFTGLYHEKAVAYADAQADASGIDVFLRAYVAPTDRPSLDGICLN